MKISHYSTLLEQICNWAIVCFVGTTIAVLFFAYWDYHNNMKRMAQYPLEPHGSVQGISPQYAETLCALASEAQVKCITGKGTEVVCQLPKGAQVQCTLPRDSGETTPTDKVDTDKINAFQSAKRELELARAQFLNSDTITFLATLMNLVVLTIAVKVFSRADDQIKRYQLISRKINPIASSTAIRQSIFFSLGCAAQDAKQLASSPHPANALQKYLPAIRENIRQASKSGRDSSIEVVGMQRIVRNRYLDMFGEIDQALLSTASKLADKKDTQEVYALNATVEEIRKELCDDQLVDRWEELARKLDDAC